MSDTDETAHAGLPADDARPASWERFAAATLAANDAAKTEFLSNISRELRTPLTLMLGPLEQLLRTRGEGISGRAFEDIALVHRNAIRMLRLVNAMLDFSRLYDSHTDTTYEPTDLSELTANLASNFRSLIEQAGLQFVVRCPELSEPVYVDHPMWEQIVLHLLSNAFEHTSTGEIGVAVRVRSGRAELIVRDTGSGIPAEQLPHIFERFHRRPNAHDRTDAGTSNGLALVKALAELHGGDVHVESVVGAGTMVTVALPLGSAHLPAHRVTTVAAARRPTSMRQGTLSFAEEMLRWLPTVRDAPGTSPAVPPVPRPAEAVAERTSPDTSPDTSPRTSSSPAAPTIAERRERILIADDNADMRQFLTGLLSTHYDVEAVADGAVALAIARERLPDLVLSDVMMPGLDGFALLRALRADPRTQTVSVVLVSARAGEESRIEGLDVGADDYLEKPFTARELVARINANLRLARMRREVMEHAHRTSVAEAANAAKTHFLTTMSHELRTPLNAIAGYVDLLELELYGPVAPEQRQALGRIRKSGQHLLALITDILNFSQLEAGQLQYQLQEVSVHTLLTNLGELIEPQARGKNITYIYLPCQLEAAVVHTDPDRLTQIVLNLLSNAIKFTEPGGQVTVACSVTHDGTGTETTWNRLEIRVTDTGCGIPQDKRALIFEPFVQLDRHLVRESQQGIGLGLAISRDLTRHLGGDLTVESVEGQGSTFRLMLPRWGPDVMLAAENPLGNQFGKFSLADSAARPVTQ